MKAWHGFVVGVMVAALAFLLGNGAHKVSAQPQQGSDWIAEQAKLPPDIHPDTLSRAARTKREDFSTDAEKKAFDEVANRNEKQAKSRWLGPSGTRLIVPALAQSYNKQIGLIHEEMTKNGVALPYQELTIAVVTRETDNRDEFLNHSPDAIKQYGQKVQDIIRTRADTKGLDPKQAAIIQFGRELFHKPVVSSRAFADLEKNFGKKGALTIALLMCYYDSNWLLMRTYDQHMDTSGVCPGPHMGCLDTKNPPAVW